MSAFLDKEEMENLKSLKSDLVNPVKGFLSEVGEDTLGDAKRFYSAKARKAEQRAKTARENARKQMEAIRREQEEMKKRRKVMARRAAVILAVLSLLILLGLSAALRAHADGPDPIALGEACLSQTPPDYENAAMYFRRAGKGGNAEGYYHFSEIQDWTGEILSSK